MIHYKVISYARLACFGMTVLILIVLSFNMFIDGLFADKSLISESVSLLIAIISLMISFMTVMIAIQNNRPIITISLDFNSRHGFVQLSIENVGSKPARNIILSYQGQSIWLTTTDKTLEDIVGSISIIGAKNIIRKNLGSQDAIDINASNKISIRYTDAAGIILYTDKTEINFNDFKDSLSYDSELTRTLYELQNIPKAIRELKNK